MKEIEHLHHYLKNTVGWLCLNPEPFQNKCETDCLIHRIWWSFEQVNKAKWMTNSEKKSFYLSCI